MPTNKERFLAFILKVPTEIYIFLFALFYRLPALGFDLINHDAYHWKERGYAFGGALTSLDFAGTAVTYHPGVTLLWSQFVAIKVFSLLEIINPNVAIDPFNEFLINHQIQKLIVVILSSILITFVHYSLKRVIGEKTSIVTILLILLEPFYLSLSREIHLDVFLTLFIFLSFINYYLLLKTVDNTKIIKNKFLYLAGIFTGLALLTKSSALFLIPMLIVVTLIIYTTSRNIKIFGALLFTFLLTLITFELFWPVMWVNPLEALNSYIFQGIQGTAIEEGHGHLWFGQETSDPGWLFYPIVLIGRFSPVLVIFGILGIFFMKKISLKRKIDLEFLILLAIYIVSFTLMVTLPSKKLDRYLLPVVLPLAIFAGLFMITMFSRKLFIWIFSLILLVRVGSLILIHPNYLAYYSPLIGGNDKGRYIIEPKWTVGYDKIAMYFNERQLNSDVPIKVAIAEHDYLRPFAKFEVLNIKHEVERDRADYFVLPIYRPERNEFYLNSYDLSDSPVVIKVGIVDYYLIYEKNGKK